MISYELETYLFENPKYRIEVKKRQYDGLYNVYRPYIDLNADTGVHSISWETIAVCETEREANEFIKDFLSN